jgi:hypothetical protein
MGIIRKHKPIFYRPGMISLVCIPLLCFYFFYKNDSFKVYASFDFRFVPDSVFLKKEIPNLRKYKEFSFNNSELLEHNKFKDLEVSLRKLKKENDTINGIKIHFGKSTNYAVFIKVLDILTIAEMPIYCPYRNDIWVLVQAKPKPSKYKKIIPLFTCGNYEANKEYYLEMEQKAEREKQYFLFKKYWILFLGYFGIVVLNIFALIKFSKRKIIH